MLDAQQSADQFGFRPTCSIRGAFTVLENMSSKTAESDVPLWLASLDFKKTFDQINLLVLLQAVSEQGVPDHYTNLLAALYADQTAATRGSRPFPIRRSPFAATSAGVG